MKMEQTVCSETSAYKIQMPGNYPEENIQHTEHGESLKSKAYNLFYTVRLTEERVFKQLREIEVSVLNVITIICKLFYVFCAAGMEMTLRGWNVIPH
jgi:hypothetical protein